MTYVKAYERAKARAEATGKKYFVYLERRIGRPRTYHTARVTKRNWIDAIFSEKVFPEEGLVSTHTAQEMMYAMLHGSGGAR